MSIMAPAAGTTSLQDAVLYGILYSDSIAF